MSPFLSNPAHSLPEYLIFWSLVTAMLSLGGFFVYFLAQKDEIIPKYRGSVVTSAMICGIAAVAYYFIWNNYEPNQPFPTILRYIDWTITTPLLLLKYNDLLKVRGYQFAATLIVADLFMIVTGLIGELQGHTVMGHWVPNNGDDSIKSHWIWGTISTFGYLVIIWQLFTTAPRLAKAAGLPDAIQSGIKSLNWYIVSLWGVYPVVYILEGLSAHSPSINLDWCQVASSVADVLNKVLFGVSAYLIVKSLSGDDQNSAERVSLNAA